MTNFTGTLRGDGLARAQRALIGFETDPQRLNRERTTRFDDSPPPYTSDRSGTTTRSQSPNPPSEEQRLRQERRVQLGRGYHASEPYHQFEHQISEEEKRVWDAELNRTHRIPIGSDPYTIACETVKRRWVEQGIWNSKWKKFANGRWKHEEPLECELESDTETEVGPSPPLFSFFPKPQPKPKLPKSDDEKRRIAERQAIRVREREASRPYHQFVYQISKERERIQEESANSEGAGAITITADINTTAYENVKNLWIKRGIWNKRWGVLPGMSWKHEQPFEEMIREEMGDDPVTVDSLVNGNRELPVARIFGSSSSLAESNPRQVSDTLNPSQQGPPPDIGSAGSDNVDLEGSPSMSNSSPLSSGKRILHPTTGEALRPSKTNQSQQSQPVLNVSLGPVHPSKISKAAGKRKLGRQRGPKISGSSPPSLGMDAAEPQSPLDDITPRRSKRIRPAVPSVAKDLARTAFTDPPKRAVRTKPKQKAVGNLTTRSSSKPQGVSKRQPTKILRGKARGK